MKKILISIVVLCSTLAFGDLYSAIGVGTDPNNPSACGASSNTGAQVSAVNCSAGAGITFSGSASADYYGLHASSQLAIVNATIPGPFLAASGYGQVIDTLSVTGAPGGDLMSLVFHIEGNWSSSNMSLVRPVFSFGFNYGNATNVSQWVGTNGSGSVDFYWQTPYYSVSYFEQNPIFYSLSAQDVENSGANVTASGLVNFSNTISFDAVSVVDANGNLVNNAVVTSSGRGQQVPNVPEPSSIAFLATGAAGVVTRLRRRS